MVDWLQGKLGDINKISERPYACEFILKQNLELQKIIPKIHLRKASLKHIC